MTAPADHSPVAGTPGVTSVRLLLVLLPLCSWVCWQAFPALPVLAVLAAAILIAAAGMCRRRSIRTALAPFQSSLRFALTATFTLTAVCLLSRLVLTLLPEWLAAHAILSSKMLIPLGHVHFLVQVAALTVLSLAVCLRLTGMARRTV